MSHRTAAVLWGLLPHPRGPAAIDVSLVDGQRRRPGIRARRVRGLRPDEVTTLARIPVTTPARTLLDLAAVASQRELERALVEALGRRLTRQAEVLEMAGRHTRRAGARRLRALLASDLPAFTRSRAEARFLALVRRAQLPQPLVNTRVGAFEVDFYWPGERFVVEVDGLAFHGSAGRFESDRRRDAILAAVGVRVSRVTWHQLVNEPEAVLVRLAQALALARASGAPDVAAQDRGPGVDSDRALGAGRHRNARTGRRHRVERSGAE